VFEVNIGDVAPTIGALSRLRVREIFRWIDLQKILQKRVSGLGGRRDIPKVETHIAITGLGIFVVESWDKSGQFGVLGREIVLTAGLAVRNQA
jgi:hypothetical protein